MILFLSTLAKKKKYKINGIRYLKILKDLGVGIRAWLLFPVLPQTCCL